MSEPRVELILLISILLNLFLGFIVLMVFRGLHKDQTRSQARSNEAVFTSASPGPDDALVLRELPLTLHNDRLYISPSKDQRILRYGLEDDRLIVTGPTMREAVNAMLYNPEFKRLKEHDEKTAAIYAEYD